MKIKDGFILKEVSGQFIVVPVDDAVIDFNGMLTLNKTAKLLFESLQEEKTVEELANLLVDKYQIGYERALADVKDFLTVLASNDILES
ncbi:MAG: PqqD family protein [Bacilli bacterium]|nr:PqqD family protein [Bacilli bacterium]MDD4077276.1 PqqD family protein [Bacilli bacterium]MDD4387953.1 PqqD family protein [Bacilli bacterium]